MKLRKLFASNDWFLVGAILFSIAGITYYLRLDGDKTIINFFIAALFLGGYFVRAKFNKKKK